MSSVLPWSESRALQQPRPPKPQDLHAAPGPRSIYISPAKPPQTGTALRGNILRVAERQPTTGNTAPEASSHGWFPRQSHPRRPLRHSEVTSYGREQDRGTDLGTPTHGEGDEAHTPAPSASHGSSPTPIPFFPSLQGNPMYHLTNGKERPGGILVLRVYSCKDNKDQTQSKTKTANAAQRNGFTHHQDRNKTNRQARRIGFTHRRTHPPHPRQPKHTKTKGVQTWSSDFTLLTLQSACRSCSPPALGADAQVAS